MNSEVLFIASLTSVQCTLFKSLLQYAWEKAENVREIMAYIRLVVVYSYEVWNIYREDQII